MSDLLDVSLDEPKDLEVVEVKEIELTNEAKEKIIKAWHDAKIANQEPPSLPTLAKLAFGKEVEIRSPEMTLVKKFIASQKFMAAPAKKIELTIEQKAYIDNNAFTSKPLEIAKILFRNQSLTPLHHETRIVAQYWREITAGKMLQDDTIDEEYSPPTRLPHVVARIKKYIQFVQLDAEALSSRDKQCCQALMSYLHTLRFKNLIESFDSNIDRELFESQFIRCCYDKSDLTPEEVDQYIVYSNEVVISKNILSSINKLQAELNSILDNDSEENKKLSVPLVDAIKTIRDEYNQSVKRQQDLLKDLKVKRSERISKSGKEKVSIIDFVQAWKDEEFRVATIHLANKQKEILKDEIKKLSDMDALKARIFGLSENEVLNG